MTQQPLYPKNAQFNDSFFPTIDGVVRTVHNYAKLMNESGSYSCVLAPTVRGRHTDDLPYDVIRARSIWVPLREYSYAAPDITPGMTDFLMNGDFKLFHTHSPFGMGRFALKKARKLGIPIVATFHSKYYDDILNVSHSRVVAEMLTEDIVRFYQSVDEVWSCSEGTANTLRSYGYNGKIFVIDNGTDYEFPADPESLRKAAVERFSIPEDRPTLLFVGHQVWQKNIKLVLDTAAELKTRGFDFTLVMVGEGYAANSIKNYAAKCGLDGHFVRFLGKISDIDLMKGLYLESDLFFFPSVYDNSPLVLREASVMGTPSLLVRDSNAAEGVEDGVNGLLTSESATVAADIIQSAFADGAHLSLMGANAQKTLCHPWEEIMTSVQKKYAEITNECVPV